MHARARWALALCVLVAAAGLSAESAFAHLPGGAFCSAKQPAKQELRCGRRAFYHGLGVVQAIRDRGIRALVRVPLGSPLRVEQRNTVAVLGEVLHDHLWLMRAGRGWIREAHRRLAPPRAHYRSSPSSYSVDGCLDALIRREGNYNPHLWNGGYVGRWDPYSTHGGSGAYGIPQALPGSKMASAGPDWRDNPATQIRWMIGYVNSTYGGSCAALSHSHAYGWY